MNAFQVTLCGIRELGRQKADDSTHVLSILDPNEPCPKSLTALEANRHLELRFHDVIEPKPGAVLPGARHIEQLLEFGRTILASATAARLLIHCHAGLSRSTAAAVLYLTQAYPRRSIHQTFGDVMRLRPGAWPNLRMLELGDEALGRHGEIIAAAGAFYRRTLDANPRIGTHLIRHGRSREVAWAEHWR
jgi:predicted protein tyrosine phosphatase